MRTTIVPAQITTVEDRIAGSLTLSQILLMLTPIIIGSIIYLTFPPQLHFAIYKLPLMAFVMLLFSGLAIRIKGKIILQWFVILLRFNNRPRYFIANKNDTYQREQIYSMPEKKQIIKKIATQRKSQEKEQKVTLSDVVKLEYIVTSPNMSFKFAKKGGIDVSLSEVK
jgi:hypothetical protein